MPATSGSSGLLIDTENRVYGGWARKRLPSSFGRCGLSRTELLAWTANQRPPRSRKRCSAAHDASATGTWEV